MSRSNRFILITLVLVLVATAMIWIGCEMGRRDLVGPREPLGPAISPSPIMLGIDQVIAVQNRHTDRLLTIENVVGTGTTRLADGRYAIQIMVKAAGSEEKLPKTLEGVPVIVVETGEIIAEAAPTDRIRPVPCGVSGNNIGMNPPGRNGVVCYAGTIGCVVEKGGESYFLSNNHIFAQTNRGQIGERIVQPAPADHEVVCTQDDNDVVAYLSDFCEIKWNPLRNSNTIDAAIAKIKPGIEFTCAMVNDYFTPSSTPAEAFIGMKIKKCGRTTGLTFGEVTTINATIVVNYTLAGYARFEGQIGYTKLTESGDSGSLIVTQDGNHPVALHFAGSATAGFGNPIQAVLDYFGVTVCGN